MNPAVQRVCRWLLKGLLAIALVAFFVWQPSWPALAAIHTYHERPGQTTYRSQQSLRDQTDRAWQATLFKRYTNGHLQGIYLRLVGFPGSVKIDAAESLLIDTGTGLQWRANASLDPQTQQLPESVAQYDFQDVLQKLTGDIPLWLEIPLKSDRTARLTAAPFVVGEWRNLGRLVEGDGWP